MSDELQVSGVWAGYGRGWVLQDVSVTVAQGSTVAVLGANGAGKTTLTRVIAGTLAPRRGRLRCAGLDITEASPRRRSIRSLVSVVPEGRMIFPALTVQENLLIARRGTRAEVAQRSDVLLSAFPRLAERRSQQAGSLSGGEQQMLAVSRALMSHPDFLVVDEPSLGLAPEAVGRLYTVLGDLRGEFGIGLLLVEQNVHLALQVADHAYVLRGGRVVAEGSGAQLLDGDVVHDAYLGAS